MKTKVIFTLSLFLSISLSFGQRPGRGTTNYRPNLDRFAGTWKYTNENTEVTIKLKKITDTIGVPEYPDGYYWIDESIIGFHEIKVNGVIVESFLNEFLEANYSNKESIWASTDLFDNNFDKIERIFSDKTKHRRGELYFTYVSGTPAHLQWVLKNAELIHVQKPNEPLYPLFDYSFSLPMDMEFIKQP